MSNICYVECCGKYFTTFEELGEHECNTQSKPTDSYQSDPNEQTFFAPPKETLALSSPFEAHPQSPSPSDDEDLDSSMPPSSIYGRSRPDDDEESDSTPTVYACDVAGCGRVFHTFKGVGNHKIAAHPDPATRPFPCTFAGCIKRYPSAESLQKHAKSHEVHEKQDLVCEVLVDDVTRITHIQVKCGRVFYSRSGLRSHQETYHGRWKCGIGRCESVYDTRDSLVAHRKEAHPQVHKSNAKLNAEKSSLSSYPSVLHGLSASNGGLQSLEFPAGAHGMNMAQAIENNGPPKYFHCEALYCSFRHTTEWGIREHWNSVHTGVPFPSVFAPSTLPAVPQWGVFNVPRGVMLSSRANSTERPTGASAPPTIAESVAAPEARSPFTNQSSLFVEAGLETTPGGAQAPEAGPQSRGLSLKREDEDVSTVARQPVFRNIRPAPVPGRNPLPTSRSARVDPPVAANAAEKKSKPMGPKAFADLDLRADEEVLHPTPRTPITKENSPDGSDSSSSLSSLTSSDSDESSSDSSSESDSAPRGRTKTISGKKPRPAANGDNSDSGMSDGPEDLSVIKKTIRRSSNPRTTLASSAAPTTPTTSEQPADETALTTRRRPGKRAPISAYTAHSSDSDDDRTKKYGGRVRGRYTGKDKKSEDTSQPPRKYNIKANCDFQPPLDFHNLPYLTPEEPCSIGGRPGNVSGRASVPRNPAGMAVAAGVGAASKRKRSVTSTGPADRVKRTYKWHDGGKRLREPGVRQRVEENKSKENKNRNKKKKDDSSSSEMDIPHTKTGGSHRRPGPGSGSGSGSGYGPAGGAGAVAV